MKEIIYCHDSIFESDAQVIVNTVNCKGIMGKGLALAFKRRYPDMFSIYQHECKTGRLRIGRPTLYKRSTPWILNFPTKLDWRSPSQLTYIEAGLCYFKNHYKEAGIKSIAFPQLGSRNGGLRWCDVHPLMVNYLSSLDDLSVTIYIHDDSQCRER